jgi:ribokinase/sulfofructose kinase
MSLDVVVVGSAVRDEYYTLSNLPEPDGGAFVHGFEEAVGGVGANVAVALARLDRDVGLVARVGEPDAPTIEAHLDAEGVDTERLRRGDEEPTYSMVFRDGDGERMVVTGGDSTRSLALEDGDLDYARRADLVFTYGYIPDPVVRGLLDADTPPIVFDLPGPLAELTGRGTEPATVDRAVEESELLVAGAVATRDYLHCGPAEGVGELRDRGIERAALTAGEDGAYLLAGERTVAIPAFEVDTVDTTGAGDAFTAGLLDAWLLDGRAPAEAGRFAAAVAALNCREHTAQRGLPSRDEVEAFLERGAG